MEMLRWILLAVGVLIFVGIYLFSRRASRRERELEFDFEAPGDLPELQDAVESVGKARVVGDKPASRAAVREELENLEQELDQLSEIIAADKPATGMPATAASTHAPPAESRTAPPQPKSAPRAAAPAPSIPVEEKIITLYLAATGEEPFAGPDIDRALRSAGLQHGEMSIYHKTLHGQAVFSVANIVEPGTFDLDALDDFTSPGLTLFMQLPGPTDGLAAFDAMAAAGRHIAEQLDGELRDKHRNPVSKQMLDHLREEIQEYQRRTRVPPVSA